MPPSQAEYDRKRVGRHIGTSQGPAVPFPVGLAHYQRIDLARETTDITEDVDYPLASELDGESFTPVFIHAAISDRNASSGNFAGSVGMSNAFLAGAFQDVCMHTNAGTPPIVSMATVLGQVVVGGVGWLVYFAYPDPNLEGILRLHWDKLGGGRTVWGGCTVWGKR